MESNYSLSDIAAVTDGGFNGGGMGGWWMIILFALIFNGGGLFGGNNRAASVDEVASGFNFAGINNKLNEIVAGQASINQNLGNAICSSTYELASKIDNCCCNTQLGIQGVKFDMANYTAAINANTTAQTQKILDAITGNRMADMQNQINQLQLQAALCGIPRTSPYGYGIYSYPTCQSYGCTNI